MKVPYTMTTEALDALEDHATNSHTSVNDGTVEAANKSRVVTMASQAYAQTAFEVVNDPESSTDDAQTALCTAVKRGIMFGLMLGRYYERHLNKTGE